MDFIDRALMGQWINGCKLLWEIKVLIKLQTGGNKKPLMALVQLTFDQLKVKVRIPPQTN